MTISNFGSRHAPGNKSSRESRQNFKVCFCFKRMFRLKGPEPPEEILNIFYDYSRNGTMSVDDLYNFLVDFQGEESGDATKKHAHDIFHSLKHLNIFQRRGLHFDAFFRYLSGDLNGPLAEVIILDED